MTSWPSDRSSSAVSSKPFFCSEPTRAIRPGGILRLTAIRRRPGSRVAAAAKPPSGRGRRCRRVEEERRVGHPARDRAVDAEALPRVLMRRERHAVALRLDAEQATPQGRDADRAAAVGAEAESGEARRHRRSCAAAGPARRVLGFHGLRVAPKVFDSVNGQIVISGTLVLPITIAPASRRRRTTSPSCSTAGPCARSPTP